MTKTTAPASASRAASLAKAADEFNSTREDTLEIAMEIAFRLETFCEGERIHWGHVGSMSHVKEMLEEALSVLVAVDPS